MNGETPITEIVPGLYQIGDSASPSSPGQADAFTYFLTRDAQSPSVLPSLDDTWEDLSLIGWYIFLAEEIGDGQGQAFVQNGRASLPSLADNPNQPNPRVLIWMASVTSFAGPWMLIYAQTSTPINRTLPGNAIFNFGLLGVTIPGGANVALSGGSLQITADLGPSLISYNGIPQTYQPYGPNAATWLFNLDFTGPLSGSFVQTQMAFFHGQLEQNFGCNFRYFYDGAGGSPESLAYAFTPPVQPQDQTYLGLNFYLDPIHPTDSGRTRIELDLGTAYPPYQTNSAALRAPYFSTTTGGTITLAPVQPDTPSSSLPPGWAFCAMPPAPSSPAGQALYLAPVGTYAVVQIDDAGSPGSPANSALWMPGLFAQEFLELAQGDQIELVSNQPAYAPSFTSAASGSQPAALDPTYTTSWVRFPLTKSENPPGYFGQPSASVYYGARQSDVFPRALSAQLSNLEAPMLFPIGPYGGIFAGPNQNGSAQTFAAYEATILSGVRHAQAPLLEGGPRFHSPAARQSRFARALAAPDPVGWGTTPQGFLAGLDGDGGWVSLTLACSPQDPTDTIGFEGTGSPNARVNPLLASALLEGQLFLVISDPANLGQFKNKLSLGGFNFTLDIPSDEGGLGTVLIFKYNTSQTLEDLAQRTELWSNKDNFIQDLAGTQAILLNALAQAGMHSPEDSPPDPTSPFAFFRQIATDPSWTGVLALNCAINGNGMPLDLQILLGGINGQLRAHHLGIQSTPVSAASPVSSPGAKSSSLFGVIHYPSTAAQEALPPTDDGLSYEIEILNVVFSNSKITQFHVVAGLTANELFGRAVELVGESPLYSPANTLSIPGQYQMQGAVGVVTFATAQPFIYAFPIPEGATRVLQQVVFDSASLVPVSSTAVSAGTAVVCRFQLGGGLFFNTEPFPNTGIDLFSYGTADGLPFANLTVEVTFTLDANGVAQDKQVSFDPSLITVTPSTTAIRKGSLLYSLPLQVSSLDSGTSLQSLASGSTPLHVLELEGHPGELVTPVTPGLVSPETAPGSWPYVTNAPAYALEFDLPLGSLGSLSDVHAGIMARMLLGWGPSGLVPDADAAAILVQLPQLSAGYGGFNLQGILKTTFGDANLLKVDLPVGPVYALMFGNIKLSVLGYSFPPGYTINFILFAGTPAQGGATNSSNVAWFVAAQPPPGSPS
jgi:hypothetical protein